MSIKQEDRPPMTQREAKEFTKLFSQLNEHILSALAAAKSTAEAKEPLRMLENLAGYDLPQAKTMYGLALLMQDKPWYDSKKGLLWLKKGAEEADGNDHDASFSMFQYGIILIDGQMGVSADPVTGKYWIDKAADAGYEPAIKEQKNRWK